MWQSQGFYQFGRVNDTINLVKSRTLLKYGRVKDSIDEFDLVESKTLVEKTLNQSLKEFLFGNVQIRFKSQGLLYKASRIELGTPHETQPYLFYQTKIQI